MLMRHLFVFFKIALYIIDRYNNFDWQRKLYDKNLLYFIFNEIEMICPNPLHCVRDWRLLRPFMMYLE